jgi:CheY-like chemotaxis protein
MAAVQIRQRATIVKKYADVVAPVAANESRRGQLLLYRVGNAAQALPAGLVDPTITMAARRAGEHVEVSVADNGVGIAAEHLPHVFEPFFTTKIDRGGTGLGLSICHELVTSQGGEISLTSEPGHGTCVTVRLPVARHEGTTAASKREAVRRRRVLLVDDEVKIAQLMQATLDVHDVTIASSGQEALALLTAPDRFDVIVCDLMMPGVGGIDVHDAVAARYPGLERRIVFITGGVFTSRTERFLAEVPNTCLTKPFSTSALIDAIEQAAAR